MRLKSITTLLLASSLGLLSGCSATYKDASNAVDQTQADINRINTNANHPAPSVITTSGYYVDPNPVPLNDQPAWETAHVSLQADKMPLSALVSEVLRNTPVVPSYDTTVKQNTPISMHYKGDIAGALKTLSAKSNYAFSTRNNVMTWSTFEDQTINISFMPGSSNYMVGQSQNGSVESNSSTSATNQSGSVNDQQYSNLSAQLSVWRDLRETLDKLKSKQGTVMVSESTTTVTVHDHPGNVAAMTRYINAMNKMLSKEVAIKVEVLEINLNKSFNAGVNWNAVAHTLGTSFNLKGNLASATNLLTNQIGNDNDIGSAAQFTIGSGNTSTMIQALSQQGKLRTVTRPQVVTMNNQIASIRITQDTGYIQSVSTTVMDQNATTSITPGNITDGFTLYLLPKIQKKDVFMQITSTMSNLLSLQKQSNTPEGVSAKDSTKNKNFSYQAIQVPTISQKQFNQRSVVKTGSTLVIAGFKSLRDQTINAKMFGLPGGGGAKSNNVETIILITPTILQTNSGHVDY